MSINRVGMIWILVAVLYGLFSLWYFNWSGPITAAEVDSFMTAFDRAEGNQHTAGKTFRTFLEQDDGKEFVMQNLVQLHDREISHPVFQARTVGGNIDSWNAENNVGFTTTAMMRYKSRRDLVELVIDPAFADGHIYKLAAIERTISYPTQITFSAHLRPPVAVFLVLIMLASLVQNLLTVSRASGRSPHRDGAIT